MYLVPVSFTFYIQGVLKLKKNSGAKRLRKYCARVKTGDDGLGYRPVVAL